MKKTRTKYIKGKKIILTSMTRGELADLYNVCRKTLYNWFKLHNIIWDRALLTPVILEEVYEKIGVPGKLLELAKYSKND